ncbi:MAG: DUF4388 domain-containing protein [Anaerolineae bacterium]
MAVSGSLRDMSLTGLISVNCNEGNQARLQIQHADQEAVIYFDGGQIAHMEMGRLEGEEVMQRILTWEEGTFEMEMEVPPPKRTVDSPWSNLVLGGMQAIDESITDWEEDSLDENPLEQFTETLEVKNMATLKELLKEMSGEIPGFQAASVSGLDGLSIAEYTASPDFNMEMAAAQFALVMKLVQKSTGQLKSGEVEDNLVTSDSSYILSRFLGDGHYFLVIAVDRDMASLGNVRLMTRNFASDLWDAIPRR